MDKFYAIQLTALPITIDITLDTSFDTKETNMNECYLNSRINERTNCDHGFMGTTHALSAVAIFLIITAFFPNNIYAALGSSSIWIIILTAINTAGSSLTPDLDNTSSTSKSSLGLLGDILSIAFRESSAIIQTTIKTKYDKNEPNPHRGFYHTFLASILIGLFVYLLTSINFFHVTLPYFGKVGSGFIFAIIVTWLNLQMALAGLFNEAIKSIKKSGGIFGELITFAISLFITLSLFVQIKDIKSFWWLGVSITAGMIIHQLGDGFTKAGVPMLFPIPIKGKLWWNIRIMGIGITAGGVVEKVVFMPIFGILIILSFLRIAGVY